jgi:hypothetical protein
MVLQRSCKSSRTRKLTAKAAVVTVKYATQPMAVSAYRLVSTW